MKGRRTGLDTKNNAKITSFFTKRLSNSNAMKKESVQSVLASEEDVISLSSRSDDTHISISSTSIKSLPIRPTEGSSSNYSSRSSSVQMLRGPASVIDLVSSASSASQKAWPSSHPSTNVQSPSNMHSSTGKDEPRLTTQPSQNYKQTKTHARSTPLSPLDGNRLGDGRKDNLPDCPSPPIRVGNEPYPPKQGLPASEQSVEVNSGPRSDQIDAQTFLKDKDVVIPSSQNSDTGLSPPHSYEVSHSLSQGDGNAKVADWLRSDCPGANCRDSRTLQRERMPLTSKLPPKMEPSTERTAGVNLFGFRSIPASPTRSTSPLTPLSSPQRPRLPSPHDCPESPSPIRLHKQHIIAQAPCQTPSDDDEVPQPLVIESDNSDDEILRPLRLPLFRRGQKRSMSPK
jgi:hypothetical protein